MAPASGPPEGAGRFATLWWAAHHPPADPTTFFDGKTVLITGANTGLGLEAAIKFAHLRAARLILAVRNVSKGKAAKATILAHVPTGSTQPEIRIVQFDASVYSSVRSLATIVSDQVEQLDVVLLNAGVAAPSYEKSSEGWEMSIQINVLCTALLAILLLPKLRDTAQRTGSPPILEINGSISHKSVTPQQVAVAPDEKLLDKLNAEQHFNIASQYAISKLLVMYIQRGLVEATRVQDGKPQVIVVVCCPALCKSDLGRNFPWYIRLPNYIMQAFFARSTEEGSRTLVSGAALGIEGHGKFWTHDTFHT